MFYTAHYSGSLQTDGVQRPVTAQGEVTLNVRASEELIDIRKKADVDANHYRGGADMDNHHVMPFELVYAYKRAPSNVSFHYLDNPVGFVSLNGEECLKEGKGRDVTANLVCLGAAKTPYRFDDENQPKHGFSVQAAGHVSTFATGPEHIYPGDLVEFRAPDPNIRPKNNGALPENRIGTPYHKQRPHLLPVTPNDFGYEFATSYVMMITDKNAEPVGGISDITEEQAEEYLKDGPDNKKIYELSESQEMALLLREFLRSSIMGGAPDVEIAGLVKNFLDGTATPAEKNFFNYLGRLSAVMNNVKREKIVGTATNHADQGGQLNLIIKSQ